MWNDLVALLKTSDCSLTRGRPLIFNCGVYDRRVYHCPTSMYQLLYEFLLINRLYSPTAYFTSLWKFSGILIPGKLFVHL